MPLEPKASPPLSPPTATPTPDDDDFVQRSSKRSPDRSALAVVSIAACLSLIVAGAAFYNHRAQASDRQVAITPSDRRVDTAAALRPRAAETPNTVLPTQVPVDSSSNDGKGVVAVDATTSHYYIPPGGDEPLQLTDGTTTGLEKGIHDTFFGVIDYRGRPAVLIDHVDFGRSSNQPFEELRVYPVDETSGVDDYVVLEHREWNHFSVDWYYNVTAQQHGDVLWIERDFNQGSCYFIDALDMDGNIVEDPNNPVPRPSPEVLQWLITNWDDPACPSEVKILGPPPAPRVLSAVLNGDSQESAVPDATGFRFYIDDDDVPDSPKPGTAAIGVHAENVTDERPDFDYAKIFYFPLDGGEPIYMVDLSRSDDDFVTFVTHKIVGTVDYHGSPAVLIEYLELSRANDMQGNGELRLYPVEETGRVDDYVVWERRTIRPGASKFFSDDVEQHGDVVWVNREFNQGMCYFNDAFDLDGNMIDDPNNPSPRPDLEAIINYEIETPISGSNCSD